MISEVPTEINPSYKVIADHLRSSAFLIADGVLPSNEGRGYVLRRIMRRAMRHVHMLGAKESTIYKLVPSLVKKMGDAYPELKIAQDLIIDILKTEEERFRITLDRGLEILDDELKNYKQGQKFSGKIAFKLYDTYGFPIDLTQDILKEKKIEVDVDEFNSEMELQKKRARESWVGSGEIKESDFYFELKAKYGLTRFTGYEQTKSKSKILAIIKDKKEVTEVNSRDKNIEIILDQTPFYATSGGQKGDDGNLILSSEYEDGKLISYQKLKNVIDISETRKFVGGLFVHFSSEIRGQFKVGDEVVSLVNKRSRQFRSQNHSATHLLHFVLKQVLGSQVTQKGSNINSESFTFDFNHHQALSEFELDKIEDLVNFFIRQNTAIKTEIMPINEARNKGAVALFGEKYDNEVRVLSMAEMDDKDLSVEFCGGTHVKATGNIGLFKIISERAVASGVRRIEAKTGFFAFEHIRLQEKKLRALLESMKLKQATEEIRILPDEFYNPKRGFDDVAYFLEESSHQDIRTNNENLLIKETIQKIGDLGEAKNSEIKAKEKEIEKLKKDKLSNNSGINVEKIAGVNFIYNSFDGIDQKTLRDLINQLKSKKEYQLASLIILFAVNDNRVSVLISLSPDLASRFNASKLINIVSSKIGGNGGGKADFATGGGVDKSGIADALKQLKDTIKNN